MVILWDLKLKALENIVGLLNMINSISDILELFNSLVVESVLSNELIYVWDWFGKLLDSLL